MRQMPERMPDSPARTSRLPYRPALDGLRALAVLAVLLYHADIAWAPGGFLGVEVFFVLSGYLITALLLTEWQDQGRIDLTAFWLRRARRLLPALCILLASVLAFAVLFLPEEVASLRGDALATAGYVLNWRLIFEQKPYFETVGRPPLLQHLWSLAVEEQFYVLWPLLFAAGMRGLRRGGMLFAVCTGAAAATLLMAQLYQPDSDPSRVYYGTDTRTAGFLAGAALALIQMPVRRPSSPNPLSHAGRGGDSTPAPTWRRRGPWDGRGAPTALVLDCFGLTALGALAWQVVAVDEFQPRLYQGGLAAIAILSTVVVASAGDERARLLPRLLGWGPLRWVGLRSYGIYLWHWPIFMVTRPQLDISLDGLPLLTLRIGTTLAVAELSYRYVELPIRSGALGRAWRALRNARGSERWRLGARWVGAAAVSLTAALALGVAAVEARPPELPAYLIGETSAPEVLEIAAEAPEPITMAPTTLAPTEIATLTPSHVTSTTARLPGFQVGLQDELPVDFMAPALRHAAGRSTSGGEPAAEVANQLITPAETATIAPTSPPISTAPPTPAPPTATALLLLPPTDPAAAPAPPAEVAPFAPAPTTEAALTAPAPQTIAAGHVLAIGDSVMIGAAKQLRSVIGDIEVDAKVSRQAVTTVKLVRARRDAGQLGDVVVIHIGTNGPFSAQRFDEIMGQLVDVRRVVVVTVKVPRRWEAPNNNMLVEGVTRYPNAVLVDWRAASADHPELFWRDGIHLRPAGARLFVDLIAAAVHAP
jgi:peptidoglycan/LPS O-acetylase OafA/YrhL